MKDRIGEIAGKIWTILGEKQNVDISKLPKILKEKSETVYQAYFSLDKLNMLVSDLPNREYVVAIKQSRYQQPS